MNTHAPAQGKPLLDADGLARTLSRIAHEIIEGNPELDDVALVGIQTRGVPLARRLARLIDERAGVEPAPFSPAASAHTRIVRRIFKTTSPFAPESLDRDRQRALTGDHPVHLDGPFAGFRLTEQSRAAETLALVEHVDGGGWRVGHFLVFDKERGR